MIMGCLVVTVAAARTPLRLGHLESVEVGYSDIFLEYSIHPRLTTRSICLECSDIYLEYVNPFPIPGTSIIIICLEYHDA
jgi:hypothetical protein